MRYTSKSIYDASTSLLSRAMKEPNNMRRFMDSEPELKSAFDNFVKNCARNAGIKPETKEYEALMTSLLYGFSLKGELDSHLPVKPSTQFSSLK